MKRGEDNLDILQHLEFAVIEVWRSHPEITDHVVARAYEAAFERYRAEARGHQPKACELAGLDRAVFDAVTAMCEFRLGRGPLADGPTEPIPPISVATLLDCLRDLRKSVERHTKRGGRQGYLTFVNSFIK